MNFFQASALSILIAVATVGAHTQAQDVVDPRLILNTSGPTSQIRAFAFSNDSTRLYSGGLDKLIHVWQVGWNGNPNEAPAVTYTRPLHWEIARGNRGSIFCLGVCPTRDEMIVGGLGARQQSGDIAVFDLAAEQIIASLPTPAERQQASDRNQLGTEGHQSAVVALDYSPSGNQILSRDERGGMFLWRRLGDKRFVATRLKPENDQASRFPLYCIFLSETVIVYADGGPNGQAALVQRNLETGREFRFPEPYGRRVAGLARDRKGDFWAAADGAGNINISSIKDPQDRRVIEASLPEITSLAFGRDTQLAIVSNASIDGKRGRVVVDLFDARSRERLDSTVLSESENSLAVAISPDGQFLATHREDPRQVIVHPLNQGNDGGPATRLGQPITSAASSLKITELSLSPEGTRLGFGESETQLNHALDLATGEIVPDQTPKATWRRPETKPNGWSVELLHEPVDELLLVDPTGIRWSIGLNPSLQGTYFSHTFLYRQGDSREPVGIAIGTENVDSLFVYLFDRSNAVVQGVAKPRLVRWYRDHTGAVTSLVQSSDRATLFSASMDGTLKAWRLGGLLNQAAPAPRAPFNQQSFWGCDFIVEGNDAVARSVDPEGIAFARGLRNGDRISLVQGYDSQNPNQVLNAEAGAQSAQQIVATLDRLLVFEQVLVQAKPPVGENVPDKAFIIRPSWLPIVTGVADRRGEWAIWHPDGYFNASAAEGGGLFQWLINQGQDKSPRVLEGGFLSKQFERPEVIQRLLLGNSIEAALAGVAAPGSGPLVQAIKETPDINIIEPLAGATLVADEPITIVAQVNFGAANENAFDVSATIDGVRLGAGARRVGANGQPEYVWTTRPRGRLNQIEVVAREPGGALATTYASDFVYRRGDSDNPTPYELSVLSIASANYRGKLSTERGGFGKLTFPIDDVEAVVKLLREKEVNGLGKYSLGTVRELRDDQVTPAAVQAEIDSLNQSLSKSTAPKLLLIYLSGHGTTIDREYHYVTTTSPSANPADLKKSSLSWSMLSEAGVAGCRVIYMIDTCHSGSAVDAKSSIRDPLRSGGIVIAAASGREAAQELVPLGHGSFTFSVLAGLNGDADGTVKRSAEKDTADVDGLVDLEELVTFVQDFVPKLTSGEQQPSATPSRLSETLRIPLVATQPSP